MDPKQKRMWIAHGVRALRLAGKYLEQREIDELQAKMEEIERRLEEAETTESRR